MGKHSSIQERIIFNYHYSTYQDRGQPMLFLYDFYVKIVQRKCTL